MLFELKLISGQCRAMNRSLTNVIFGGIATTASSEGAHCYGAIQAI